MTLETAFERVELSLESPFEIARGASTTAEGVVIRIGDEAGTEGVGAGFPSARYGETAETVEAVLPTLLEVVEDVGDPHQLERVESRMAARLRRNPAARCAVSVALHDLVAKRLDLPLYRYFGLDPEKTVSTSYTVGIDDPEAMGEAAARAVDRGFEVLKVKLGTDRDEARVAAVREAAPDATIRVDANEAWTPREAVATIEAIATYDLEFVEQPVAAADLEGLRFVTERSPVPIAADEACETAADVPRLAGRCDVANLKLAKCGGLREAIRLIHAARAHGLEVMCGCMVESNASLAAACHLAPLLDYADLDGSLLLAEDPFDGVPMEGGRIDLESLERPGTGAVER